MPTVLLLDVSLSMSRLVPLVAPPSPSSEPLTYRQLAISGINSFLDQLYTNNKLEFVSLVIFSSLYEQVVPFTRDYNEIRNALGKIEEYNKTCIDTVLRGVNTIVMDEWGTAVQCQVIMITDGNFSSVDRQLATTPTLPSLGFRLNVVCMTQPPSPPPIDPSSPGNFEPIYRRLIAAGVAGGKLYIPEAPTGGHSIHQTFTTICDDQYTPFTGTLHCGNLWCPINLFPPPESYNRESELPLARRTISRELKICGFLDIRDISNPPYISRHLVLPLPASTIPPTPSKSDSSVTESKSDVDVAASDEKDVDKSAAFTVLLHGSLKVEQMVAIVDVGEDWYGMMYSYADSKKKSNLVLSIFQPGDNCLPWLGKMSQLGPAAEFVTSSPYGDDPAEGRSPFPVIPTDKRSYTQNCVVWIKNAGIQADIQKILRTAKRLPEKNQHFYKELNRLRSAALSLGFYELLGAIAHLLDRECAQLPGNSHPDATLQMSHAASFLRDPQLARDASHLILPLRTNFSGSAAD